MPQQVKDRDATEGLDLSPFEADLRRHRPRRRTLRRLRVSAASLSAIAVLAFPVLSVERTHDLAPWIGYQVRGKWQYAPPPGVTFEATVARFGLKPANGSLLDVEGEVLRANAYPGAILLNGLPASGDPLLSEGDQITVRNGKDHVEGLAREVIQLPAGRPSNPQFYLGTIPGEQIIEKGKISGKVVSSVFHALGPNTHPNEVALTFDDGPWPSQTPQVLAILKKFKVKATFFVVGYLAQRYPDIIRAEVNAGMMIGDHTWDHPNSPFRDLPSKTMLDEIARNSRYLTSIGIKPIVFRPPGGSYSDAVISGALKFGMRTVIWSIDPKDWTRPTKDEIVQRVLSQVRPGSIILMHDGGGDRSATIAALPEIIQGIRKMGLGFATLA
jgi:peptidoglycan/xylan/chitin deacetylase (PgdA/CDA1 family)